MDSIYLLESCWSGNEERHKLRTSGMRDDFTTELHILEETGASQKRHKPLIPQEEVNSLNVK